MPCITLRDAILAFGHWPLLDGAQLNLRKGQRVGLIGRNGTGKSSLLKVLAGELPLDAGQRVCRPGVRIAHVAQEPQFDEGHTVFEAVSSGLGALQQVLLDYEAATARIAWDHSEPSLFALQQCQSALEAHDGWRFQSLVETVLSRLALDPIQPVDALSGGWKKRVALARALVSEPDILLLDEPTNHLDMAAVTWLEEFLSRFNGALLLVTHDRYFLDRVASHIVELDRGQLQEFVGNYADYRRKKSELLEIEAIHQSKFDTFWKAEEAWIRKGVEARRTRNEGRVRRLEALRQTRSERRTRPAHVRMQVDAGERSGKLIVAFEHIHFSFGDRPIIQDFSTRIQRGDRIGIIGPNGAGKTTLLKLILGELTPQAGRVQHGTKQTIAYFDQFRTQLDEDATLSDAVSPGGDFIEIQGQRKHVISYLEEFLFSPARARSPVRSLSGGERNRLLLARLFARPANVLVLDEPTNDLDIETLELLEALLLDYRGAVFLVSHDRTFLDHVVTSVIGFGPDGMLRESIGGYSDWQNEMQALASKPTIAAKPAQAAPPAPARASSSPSPKLSFAEKRALEALPAEIEALELKQAQLQQTMLSAEFYRQPESTQAESRAQLVQLETQLEEKMRHWEALESKANPAQ